MTYTNAEARAELLDALAQAIEQIGLGLAYVGEAYERVDDDSGERLEQALFRPLQLAYGRAKRTQAEFAARHGQPSRGFDQRAVGVPSQSARELIDAAVDASASADRMLATLQDSMLPVEVGDPELRAGLSGVRELIGGVPKQARALVRTLGR